MNVTEAMALFKDAAEQGDSVGAFCYALSLFERNGCHLEVSSCGWNYLTKSAESGCLDAAVIVGLQHFANSHNFENDLFQNALAKRNFCALYDYGVSLLKTRHKLSEATLQLIVEYFLEVAKQGGDGSEYNYKTFLHKGIGVDSNDRWRIVLLECSYGLPESQYIYGKHIYAHSKDPQAKTLALQYFESAAARRHAEASFACGALLLNEFGYSLADVSHHFEDAVNGGILIAQYIYGLLLTKEEDIAWRIHGAEVLSLAAKEVLLRRQCRRVEVEWADPGFSCAEFFYSPIPNELTKHETDAYIWERLSDNIAKMDRLSWYEILHPQIPRMKPQWNDSHSGIRGKPPNVLSK